MVINIEKSLFNPQEHEAYKALAVKQPYADLLTEAAWRDDKDNYYASKGILLRSRKVNYRGDVLICSSASPVVEGHISGATCGLVELYDIKPIAELTEEEWDGVCISKEDRVNFRTGYAWFFRNPRRVIEMPVRGEMGLFTLYAAKGDIMEYPRALVLGADGWKKLKRRIKPA